MNRRIISLGLFGSLLLASVWYLTAYRSQSTQLADIHAQTSSVQANIADQRALAEQLAMAKTALDDHKDRILQLTQAVPEKAELADFLSTVNVLASEHNVTIESISQTPPAKSSTTPVSPSPQKAGSSSPVTTAPPVAVDASTMSVAVSARGTYEDVMAFMHGLDILPRLVVIDSFSIAASGTVSGATTTTSAPGQSGNKPVSTVPGGAQMALSLNVRVFTNQSSLEASA